MHTKIVYLSDYDGVRFDNQEDCEKYEKIVERVLNAIKRISPEGIKTDYNQAIRHNMEDVKKAYKSFMEICADDIPEYKNIFLECAKGLRHPSHASRIINDCGDSILWKTDYKFSCINKETGIEYEQPYYATHTEEFTGKIIDNT